MRQEIKFLDLEKITKLHLQEFEDSIKNILLNGWYILGCKTEEFEASFSKFTRTRFAIGVANGLDALILSLKSLGIGLNDEVIVPSNTYIATWLAVTHVGAKPIPVEPNIDTYNLDYTLLEKAITKNTKAIIAVNLYGQAADLNEIKKVCNEYKLYLIEDNAQSQGAECDGKPAGSFGIVNATSFYPGKNLGAFGDGGAITTNNLELYENILALRNYGSKVKYYNEIIGYNSRLDEIQSSILLVKLKYLIQENEHRKKCAILYQKELQNTGDLILPVISRNCTSVYHIYQIRTKKRNELKKYLSEKGIQTMIHYPVPPHLQKAYAFLNYRNGDFPLAEEIANTCLSLPIGPHLSISEIEDVCFEIKSFFNKSNQ
jgi:dTDP-4-amino-4,6-dideoxygalactose transaminase